MLLYKNVDDATLELLIKTGEIRFQQESAVVSVTKNRESLKEEFGKNALIIDANFLPEECQVIDIVYDLAWFTATHENREFLLKVTGKTEDQWREWAVSQGAQSAGQLVDMIDDEISELYASEDETVITNLSFLSLSFARIEVNHNTIKISEVADSMRDVAAQIDDLDEAVKSIMDVVGITTGDVAGLYFAGQPEKSWPAASAQERVAMLSGWLELEEVYAAKDDDALTTETASTEQVPA